MATKNRLIDVFKDFAICLNTSTLSCNEYKLGHVNKVRIVYSRLYYACYHKGLDYFPSIRFSSKGQKHSDLIAKLKDSSEAEHIKLLPLVQKLQDLRIWADYNDNNEELAKFSDSDIGYYIYQIENEISL